MEVIPLTSVKFCDQQCLIYAKWASMVFARLGHQSKMLCLGVALDCLRACWILLLNELPWSLILTMISKWQVKRPESSAKSFLNWWSEFCKVSPWFWLCWNTKRCLAATQVLQIVDVLSFSISFSKGTGNLFCEVEPGYCTSVVFLFLLCT